MKYILYILNVILFKIYDLLVNTFKFPRIYEKNLIAYDEYNIILGNIIRIFIVIFQIISISYNIFLIPQFFLKHILYYFNFILLNINDLIANTFKFSPLYEKTLIKYDEYNLILGNIIKIFIVIFQIIILFFNIFLIPQFFLKHILYYFNFILLNINGLMVNTFIFSLLYEKTQIFLVYLF